MGVLYDMIQLFHIFLGTFKVKQYIVWKTNQQPRHSHLKWSVSGGGCAAPRGSLDGFGEGVKNNEAQGTESG